jgi:hypothetical protein
MNERIKDLIQKATPIHPVHGYAMPLDPEKFAELIVLECSAKIERDYKYERGEDTKWIIAFSIANDLKAHFGVEE